MTARRARTTPDPHEVVPGQLTFDGQEVAGASPPPAPACEPAPWTPYRGKADCAGCWEDQALAHTANRPMPRRQRATWALNRGPGREPGLYCDEHTFPAPPHEEADR